MRDDRANNVTADQMILTTLRAAALCDDEIEAVAGGARSLASIRSRIAVERNARPSVGGSLRTLLIPRIAATVCAVAVCFVLTGLAFIYWRNLPLESASQLPKQTRIAEPILQVAPLDAEFVGARKSTASATERPSQARRGRRDRSRAPKQTVEPAIEFYALPAVASSAREVAAGGRVVRVDLPRASLVALGVNVPLEVEQQTWKTDLLVGPDGVPRAIRLVE